MIRGENPDTGPTTMVLKRDGTQEPYRREEIELRLRRLNYSTYEDGIIRQNRIVDEIEKEILRHTVIESTNIDERMAKVCARMNFMHPDYSLLGSQILLTKLYKETLASFSSAMDQLYRHQVEGTADKNTPRLSEAFHSTVMAHAERLDQAIDDEQDLTYTYFSFKLLEERYLFRLNGKVVERPQYMLMRVSVDINKDDIEAALESYKLMSDRYFIHSPATLASAGTVKAQMCSNYAVVLPITMDKVFQCLDTCSQISRTMGNVDIYCHDYPSRYSMTTSGLPKVIRLFRDTYLNNVRLYGPKTGQFTFYIEAWHGDIFDILYNLKTGREYFNDNKFVVLVPDILIQRVNGNKEYNAAAERGFTEEENNELKYRVWTLMCPTEAPGLGQLCSTLFQERYKLYENQVRATSTHDPDRLWNEILITQRITRGRLSVVLKKTYTETLWRIGIVNEVKSSPDQRLKDDTRTRILSAYPSAFLSIHRMVLFDENTTIFNWNKIRRVLEIVMKNLDKIIDVSFYPSETAQRTAQKKRPLAIGIHGLADVAICFNRAYDDELMCRPFAKLYQSLYYYVLDMNYHLSARRGGNIDVSAPRLSEAFINSLYNMGNHTNAEWLALRKRLEGVNLRNSAFLTVEPSREVALLLDTSNSVEPYTSNTWVINVNEERFLIFNENMVAYLQEDGEWNDEVVDMLKRRNGNMQDIDGVSDRTKQVFKTAWQHIPFCGLNSAFRREMFIDHNQQLYYFDDYRNETTRALDNYQQYALTKLKSAFCRMVRQEDVQMPVLEIYKRPLQVSQDSRPLDINLGALCLTDEEFVMIAAERIHHNWIRQ